MAWLVGAAGPSGAAGGAAGAAGSAAAGSAAAGAGAGAGAAGSAAGTAASTGASAAGSAAGSTAAAEGASAAGAGTSGAGEAAAGTSFKDSLIETGKDMAKDKLISESTKQDDAQMYKPTFTPQTVSSDINNKYNIQSASFQKHEFKKPDNTSDIGKMAKGLVNAAEEISSSENLKTDKTDISSNSENKPQSASSRFNATMKKLGQELGAYAKDEGKNLLSNAIAAGAQPQQINPVQPGFTGNQISSDEELKTDIKDAGGIVPLFSTIDSYLYKYKPEAQEEYAGTGMMNNDNNLGVMAQELQGNPLTASAVKTDEKGNLALDTGRLTSINTAMIAELCKKVMELEGQLYGGK